MAKLLIPILIICVGAFFFMKDPYGKDIAYDTKTFSLLKKQEFGLSTVYIYADEQSDNTASTETIHLVKIDDSLTKDQWLKPMEKVFSSYQMTATDSDPLKASGYQKRSGFYFSTYGKPATINGEDVMLMYQHVSSDDTGGLSISSDTIFSKLDNAYFL